MKKLLITGFLLLSGVIASAQSNRSTEENTLPAQRTVQAPEEPSTPAPPPAPSASQTQEAPPAPDVPAAPGQPAESMEEVKSTRNTNQLSLPERGTRVRQTEEVSRENNSEGRTELIRR